MRFEEVPEKIGHEPGGVCPFAVKEGVRTYLDCSIRGKDILYLGAGDECTLVKLTPKELEELVQPQGWVDVGKRGQI